MTPLKPTNATLDTWTDLSGFNQLRAQAQTNQKSVLPAVARQFEAMFTQMMLKSMREANASLGGDTLGGSQEGDTYREMFDQQIALSLANGGHGLGIARLLMHQLGGDKGVPGVTPTANTDVPGGSVRAAPGLADPAGESTPPVAPADAGGSAWQATLGSLAKGVDAAATIASHVLPAGDPVGFLRALAPHAKAAAEKLGVPVRALLAQAALETGWGKHLPHRGDGSSSFNLFGIKAGGSWEGDKVSVPTLEYEDGVAVRRRDNFRAYDDPGAAFEDYARLLANNPRYAHALGQGQDVAGFAHALARAGYATDPAYAHKLTAIADGPQMRRALAEAGLGDLK